MFGVVHLFDVKVVPQAVEVGDVGEELITVHLQRWGKYLHILDLTFYRLDNIFEAFAVVVHPQNEARRLVGRVAKNPVTGQHLPGERQFDYWF